MLFNENQEEVEGAMTPDEVEEKLQEAKDHASEDAVKQLEEIEEEHKQELDSLKEQIEEKEQELEKEKDKEKNFMGLRGKTKEKNEEIGKLTEEIKSLRDTVTEKMSEVDKGKVEDVVDGIVGGDKELKEKVMFHYNSFKEQPKTKEELLERVNNSYVLATGNKPSNPLTGAAVSSVRGSEMGTEESKGKMSDKEKEVAKNLGISDAEMKKHNLI